MLFRSMTIKLILSIKRGSEQKATDRGDLATAKFGAGGFWLVVLNVTY